MALRRMASGRFALAGAAVTLIAVGTALAAPAMAPRNPLKQDLSNTLQSPSRAHLLGTDNVGRDVLSRVIWGTRVSLVASLASVAIAVLAGGLIGLFAGYRGGRLDGLAMRLMDRRAVLPAARPGARARGHAGRRPDRSADRTRRRLHAHLRSPDARPGADNPGSRVHRGGPGPGRFQQVDRLASFLPNAATPIVVQASLSVAFAILAEASLSFLGLGVQPPDASWGSMINAGRGYLRQAPWIVFGPGAALFVTVLGLNFLGDAVRDALDPKLRV